MPHPTNSATYEQTFKLVVEVLGRRGRTEDIVIKQPDEKKAIRFRLRYYSFLKVLKREAEEMFIKGRKTGSPELCAKAEELLEQLVLVRRFKAVLEGNTVLFTDRDAQEIDNINNLMSELMKDTAHLSADIMTNTQAANSFEAKLEAQVKESREQRLANTPPRNPLDDVLDETRDAPVGISANTLLERTATRLIHGAQAQFTLPFDTPDSAAAFHLQWTTYCLGRPDITPHRTDIDGKNITFTRNILDEFTGQQP
ncbi:hypothetical protein [Methylocaldum sp.]|uniref:hypothetical protein n=1 Tax=Methylocaldum sp. TaxID=1969727 RepID=UPI002D226008|nr:hypothetical protein [Methylocaldum sp.]HYE38140.1 hypothetical protein [Methylocaldum sp.]